MYESEQTTLLLQVFKELPLHNSFIPYFYPSHPIYLSAPSMDHLPYFYRLTYWFNHFMNLLNLGIRSAPLQS